MAGQYVLGKISEARERMALDRIAKEKLVQLTSLSILVANRWFSLRRRFEQNQTDCTFTVLALLPTVTDNILEALPVEQLTHELQQKRAEKLARSGREPPSSDIGSSGPSSVTDGGDSGSLSSFQSSSYVHASQLAESGTSESSQLQRTKQQLWAELKLSCMPLVMTFVTQPALTNVSSNNTLFNIAVHSISSHAPHAYPTKPPRPSQLYILCASNWLSRLITSIESDR